MTDQELLNEVKELLRTMPPQATLSDDGLKSFAWLGRYSAVLHALNSFSLAADMAISDSQIRNAFTQ